jgi:hypothetical protein
MAKVFSFASWNVEHFKKDAARVSRVVSFLKNEAQSPDVFGIFEVLGKNVFDEFVVNMPSHNFYLTEGPESQETLVGIRKTLTAFVTQRHKFKSKVPTLRPGTMVTVHIDGVNYTLVYLHVKSLTDPRGWGLRVDMLEHAGNLKKALDKRAARDGLGPAHYLVLGDLNTMGLNVRDSKVSMTGADEIARMQGRFKRVGMTLVPKDQKFTWWGAGKTPRSNLDHVLASDHLDIRANGQAGIRVLGWPEFIAEADQKTWIGQFSDHGLLYGEVHG